MISPIKPVLTNIAKKIQKGADFASTKAIKGGIDNITLGATKESSSAFKTAMKNSGAYKVCDKLYDSLTDSIAFAIGKIAPTKPADSIIKGLQHFKKPTPRMADLASIIYTIKLMTDTSKSKKIEKERKPALIINSALVTIVSSSLAMLVDSVTDPILKQMSEAYKSLGPNDIKKAQDSIKKSANKAGEWLCDADFTKGLSKFKSLTIFTILVRILVPVLSVPVTGKITEWFMNRGKEKAQQEKELAKA